jgi:hypothetical protein
MYSAAAVAGVLYHLFGRHLDTGLPAPYSDDHWRQVVSRLGLSKHQVRLIAQKHHIWCDVVAGDVVLAASAR